ncbi:HAD family hydrolase [Pseudomonas sp. GD03817]|uniref:HAD family hydrolase n=1 Tax=Pseudomonas TaxID=286 RepID=UPI00156FB342|nr:MULTISPECIES: HAD family hydrolase [Pseudomonas]MCE0991741.1 HAD family hydrolase [Pseudomonas alloputida]MDH1403541.1 HAD family hydrolase [Pseudomonas sp. GD03730]MDH1776192.1 HAD family hydrolase [Pseudomonas sp. GD03817]QKL08922.1 HAD hydrolase-like protein [Pseudomonas putida]WNI07110.1 HAD family hydrolase [Pseudomonas putida]
MNNPPLHPAFYSTLVFDCDGVLLDSNKVKTQAFYEAALPYGATAAQALADYHVANGGVSRYKKFSYFLENIVHVQVEGVTLENLLDCYAKHVRSGLLSCSVADGLQELRDKTPNTRWLIVSGGDQAELREIFAHRNLDTLFDGGIFGSPDIKEDILAREQGSGNITFPALFIGDSKYDYKAAREAKIDFIFMSDWSEVTNWKEWCMENEIYSLAKISSLNNLRTQPALAQCQEGLS